jgi:hypothetical protein
MLFDDNTASQTFELYGPKEYSTAEIAELVDREIFKRRRHINLPKAILQPLATLANKLLWWPLLSGDEVEREFINQKIDPAAKTFKDLGLEPGDISQFTYHYLVSGSNIPLHRGVANIKYSKDSGAPPITICPRLQKKRSRKSGNICMLVTSCKEELDNSRGSGKSVYKLAHRSNQTQVFSLNMLKLAWLL